MSTKVQYWKVYLILIFVSKINICRLSKASIGGEEKGSDGKMEGGKGDEEMKGEEGERKEKKKADRGR